MYFDLEFLGEEIMVKVASGWLRRKREATGSILGNSSIAPFFGILAF
jgi:hypothetical protein